MNKPLKVQIVDAAVSALRTHLRRHKQAVPPSLAGQICGLVSHDLHMRLRRQRCIHPGNEKMAKWGNCTDRQARRNLAILRNWGFAVAIDYIKGGRRATRYVLDYRALFSALNSSGVAWSPKLASNVQDALNVAGNADVNPDIYPDINPDMRADAMSAGIHSISEVQPEAGKYGNHLRVVGGAA